MNKFKKSLSFVLTVIMLISCLMLPSFAADVCDHEWSTEYFVVVNPTCHSTGSKAQKCLKCGRFNMSSQEIVPMTAHDYVENKVDSTCSSEGLITRTCKVCGHTETETVPAKSHTLGDFRIITPSTCSKEGIKEAICSVCGAHISRPVEKIPHNIVPLPAVGATCTEDGLTEGKICYDCHEVIVPQTKIKATGHNLKPVNSDDGMYVITSTCIKNGRQLCECVNKHDGVKCTYVEWVDLPLADHVDKDGDGLCDICTKDINYKNCTCFCHHDTFFSRIVRMLNTLLSDLLKKDFRCCKDMVPYKF